MHIFYLFVVLHFDFVLVMNHWPLFIKNWSFGFQSLNLITHIRLQGEFGAYFSNSALTQKRPRHFGDSTKESKQLKQGKSCLQS